MTNVLRKKFVISSSERHYTKSMILEEVISKRVRQDVQKIFVIHSEVTLPHTEVVHSGSWISLVVEMCSICYDSQASLYLFRVRFVIGLIDGAESFVVTQIVKLFPHLTKTSLA